MILTSKARLAGVIGWPISHSSSPILHGYWLEKYKIDGAYLPFAVQPKRLKSAITGIVELGLRGVNITIPHKEEALLYVDDVSETAAKIGAVNTINVDSSGKIEGHNTDAFGFLENLAFAAKHFSTTNQTAVVLGAGGAARAVCFALLSAGISEIKLVNRNHIRANIIRDQFSSSIVVERWENRESVLESTGLLVNATSLGMSGQPPLEINLGKLPKSAIVYDLVYSPLETPLLKAARLRSNYTVSGLGMLLHQARPGFKKWFGVEPEVTIDLHSHVLKRLDTC